MEKTAIIIPARYASTRLPGKPLIEVNNKTIIQWVWEKACSVDIADNVIIATDSEKIYNKAKFFGAEVEMTSENHKCGSDRIAEVVSRHKDFEYIINLQGDEPMMSPDSIKKVIKLIQNDKSDISTLIRPIKDSEEINNPNVVKCVVDNNFKALYFSRSKIPYERNIIDTVFYAHIGIYGYKRKALFDMCNLAQTSLEKAESLEQLRALQSGMTILTDVVDFKPIGIDTKEDVEKFRLLIK